MISFRSAAPAAVAATCLAATLATAQPATFLPGEYRLSGSYADGRTTEVKLEIEVKGQDLEVERKAKRAGERLTWRATATRVGPRSLDVSYTLPLSGGGLNVIEARYSLDVEGRVLSEELRNTTRLAPEQGWSTLSTRGRRDLEDLSLGELASETLPPLFDHLTNELSAFGPQTLPHEAKALRKLIGKVRLYVDLFSYAYPKGGGVDAWSDLRETLDEGYESMGSFKDLYDEQGVSDPSQAVYDPAEVGPARDLVLRWLSAFRRGSRVGYFRYYLAHPKRNRLYERDDLSPYYWGVRGSEPKRSKSGIENLARLQRALLEQAREDLDEVARIKDDELIDEKEQEHFHSFRKALRSTVKISEFFPEVYEEGSDPSALVLFVDGVVDRYGDINDLLVAHAFAEKRGKNGRARRLAEEVEDDWDDLKDWQDDEDVEDKIRDLRRLVLN